MLDFLMISSRITKYGVEIYPRFIIRKTSDLLIRGGDFYAIWIEERGLWSTDEDDALQLIDHELDLYAEKYKQNFAGDVKILHMWDSENNMIERWHKYCQRHRRDFYQMLDEKLIFSNTPTNKKDYASKRLNYPLEDGDISAYDKIIGTLYSPLERHKIEWAIGAVVSGDSAKIQKFLVLYGAAGTGKSTILNIIQMLFEGYYSVFDAKALGQSSNSFALEAFKKNPLVAIQHDGDLSHIEDNTRLNSLISHELMTVNEKFKSTYENRFKAFLFMGTNRPVKITDGKSGLIRRLIDVTPSGKKLSQKDYRKYMNEVPFELGPIAKHCLEVYLEDPHYYDDYIPISMMGASNDFYNFVLDSYHIFNREDSTTLKQSWEMYKNYCEDAKVPFPKSKMIFVEELKNYFWNYDPKYERADGSIIQGYFYGFRKEIFDSKYTKLLPKKENESLPSWIEFSEQDSIFDKECGNLPAQYANENETPTSRWDSVITVLSQLDSRKVHYVKVPENHIVIDFDIPDENGKKSFEKNLEAANKFPKTYAELSKSGAGIHLHYIYTGDPTKLNRVYDEHIEVKVFTGKSSLRRKLTKCNDIPINTISSGLPTKGDDKVVNFDAVKSEKGLRTLIKRNLEKEIHPGTKPSITFIRKILDDANRSGLKYDVTDMRPALLAFAANSTNHAEFCISEVNQMIFKSEDQADNVPAEEKPIAFYDIEIFPNLFVICYKVEGENKPVVSMINPSSTDVEQLTKSFRLIGFNCRKYDNHIIYAALMGYTTIELYRLSKRIIGKSDNAFFSGAYNLSYTDIYDFASSSNKKSLKKLEIEMGIHHQELGLPWDDPVPENLWRKVADYCINDVIATEAAFYYLSADWTARQILASLAGMSVNDTTNTLTTRIIFGRERHPQSEFCYRNLAEPVFELDPDVEDFLKEACPVMMSVRHGEAGSKLPYFPGYKHEFGVSTYKDFNPDNPNPLYKRVGEGGCVYSEPGVWGNVALLDISSQHPHSAIAECLFGPKFTRAFRDIVVGRVSIKHEAWDVVNNMLDGKLAPFIQDVLDGKMTSGDLANALKTAINSVYGLTSAKFETAFKDPRNIDNIVAKRGALFMINLKEEVQKRGFSVAHIKTDSIKIPDATMEIIDFVMQYGRLYGYEFEHEATYDRMCLVNKSTYIARYATHEKCEQLYGYIPDKNRKKPWQWTATGDQFKIPYLFKTLFSKEPIEFKDLCKTFATTKGDLYLDTNESFINDLLDKVGLFEGRLDDEEYIRKFENVERLIKRSKLDIPEEEKHDLHFVGRVGQFCPVLPFNNGGLLMQVQNDKKGAASGTIGYRWMESEVIRTLGTENIIDRSYFDELVNDAVHDISIYGNFEWFVSDDPYVSPEYDERGAPIYPEELPFD